MENLERALLVAERAHSNQTYGIYPYMYHIKQVVGIAETYGFSEDIIVACALHDVLEDSDISHNDIKKHFGSVVADIVYRVTDELGKDRKSRKEKTYAKIKGSRNASLVKACDRLANVLYSKEYNKSMFEMYKNEHDRFCASIMYPSAVAEDARLWDMLCAVIDDE